MLQIRFGHCAVFTCERQIFVKHEQLFSINEAVKQIDSQVRAVRTNWRVRTAECVLQSFSTINKSVSFKENTRCAETRVRAKLASARYARSNPDATIWRSETEIFTRRLKSARVQVCSFFSRPCIAVYMYRVYPIPAQPGLVKQLPRTPPLPFSSPWLPACVAYKRSYSRKPVVPFQLKIWFKVMALRKELPRESNF